MVPIENLIAYKEICRNWLWLIQLDRRQEERNYDGDKLLSIDWSIFWQYREKHNVSSFSCSSVLFLLYVCTEATLIERMNDFFLSSFSLSLPLSMRQNRSTHTYTQTHIERRRRRRRRRTCSSSSSFFYYSYDWLLVDFNKTIDVST